MNTTHNERSAHAPLQVALIGHGEHLATLAPVTKLGTLVTVVAQAGMPQAAALPDIPWRDDPRILLTEPGLQAVLLATTTRQDLALLPLAFERSLPVWRLPPLACNFSEAVEFLGQVKHATTFCRVASWWDLVLDHAWNELDWPDDYRVRFSDLRVAAPSPSPQSWRLAPNDAAGGALAYEAYPLLEALLAVRGLPESVTAAIGSYRRDPNGIPSQTEDTATAILRYAGDGTAALRAAWNLPQPEATLVHRGERATVTLTSEALTLSDDAGETQDSRLLPGDFLASEMQRFGELVRSNARDRALAALERHLAVSAVLETIYLAARTDHPESPRKLYEVQGWPVPRQ